ncbi:hypothetical protein BDZ97DRAFT_475685 [Flammula alnicola]|nr:hypothetical protein BDZ97DRAFT_475685 [Flammula alnicola]
MSSLSPQVLGTTIPSPAFQKSTPPKDLTPSISRLQGRGFVQNMVKVSAQLEIPSSPTPAPSDKSRPTSAGGRKSSVLDRWQSNIQTNSPTKLQSPSPSFPNSIRRSTTQEISGSNTSSPRTPASSTFPSDASHTLKSVASLPSMAKATSAPSSRPHTEEPSKIFEPYQRSRTPGLGSATTMVLIKPSKSVTDLTQLSHVDELGVKHDSGQGARTDRAQFHISAETPSSKKPLIHPTKDRARKPKKHSESHSLAEPMQANLERDGSLASPEQEEISHSIPLSRTLTLDSVEISSQMGKENHFPQLDMGNSTKVTPSGTLRDVDAAHVSHASPNVILSDNTTQQKMIPSPVLEGRSSIELAPLPYIPGPLASPALKSSDGFVSPAMKPAQVPLSPVFSSPSKAIRIPKEGRQTMPPPGVTVPKLRKTISPTQAEKRKSSYEKYLAIALPPLKEEATPTPSPAGTLNRANARLIDLPINNPEENNTPAEYLHRETNDAPETSSSKLVDFVQSESPVPHVEIARLLESRPQLPKVAPDTQTVSVEVLAITGTTATTIVGPLDVFYESEILAIIHRVKSKSTGLASTFVWCWLGRQSILGDREERKLHDLAKRYGASAKIIHQLAEPSELIQILGGSLAIRQGTRVHWSPENTTMHLVRSLNGVIVIDEHDLDVKNLCSAFSYCLTVLGSIYVWHGCGSTPEERNAALKYSKKLSNDAASPIELLEGETDNDEMFWMILGDDGFAKADYWKWRKSCSIIDPSIWRMVPDNAKIPVVPVEFISMEQGLHTSVYVVNCIWELFVLVGKEARSDRQAIRLALDVAMKMSKHVACSRPYAPTVHALILPSKIPLDLRRGIRDFDEAWLNDGEIPDHMNLLSYSEAVHHLSTHSWEQPALRDRTMLPLGVGL